MMQAKKNNKQQNWIGEEPPGVTDDTTNKGLRPRNPPEARGEEESYYGSSRSMLIFSTPLTRGACSGETKLEGVRVTH